MRRIFVSRAIPEASLQRLAEGCPGAEIEVHRGEPLGPAALRQAARGAAALICTLSDRIDAALLESLGPELKIVSTFAVGHENIDLAAARQLGVAVANTPGVLTDATAEVAVALMLACARGLVRGDRFTREGRFRGWGPLEHQGGDLYGRRVGIIGAGRIGQRVARTLRHGFDSEILVHSRRAKPEWERELGARFVSLEALLEESDFVSLHCPLTPETRHLIDASALRRMARHACLVNTARGAVVHEAALVEALREGEIAGAGLDVYEDEPTLAPGLTELDNVVLLPHVGSATFAARGAMGQLCVDAVIAALAGRDFPNRLV